MATAYIALGTNLGNREENLRNALGAVLMIAGIKLGSISNVYETAPVGGPEQGPFLNACVSVYSELYPVQLLQNLLKIEDNLGRHRTVRWGPRKIDLDLLIYDNVIMSTPILDLPHPRLCERGFVLHPLSDIAPELTIPGRGKKVNDILRNILTSATYDFVERLPEIRLI